MANRGDIDLSFDGDLHGFMLVSNNPLQERAIHAPTRFWTAEQKTWVAGRGRASFSQEPAGYFDAQDMWTMTDGSLFPSLQWHWMKGIRNADFLAPGSVEWQKCLGAQLYISSAFTASASYNADKAYLLIRRVGNPGTLTFKLAADHATPGSPGTVLQTATVTTTTVDDFISRWIEFDWASTQALVSGTVYHVYVYGAATDTEANHWEVACDTTGSASKISAAGSTWAAGGFTMYYRVTDADISRKFYDFILEGAQYVVDSKDDRTASQVWINGDRGTATSGAATTITDTGKTWVADRWIGAWVRIISGTGDGQYRVITDNDTTSLTVAAWNKNPDNTSKYIIYGTDWWTECATTGLGYVVGRPAVANNIAHFPQGATTIRQIAVNGSGYSYGNDNPAYTTGLHAYVSNGAWQLVYMGRDYTTLYTSTPITALGASTWTSVAKVGGTDYNFTNILSDEGVLTIIKEDGPYKVSGSIVSKMSSGFDAVPSLNTGVGACWHNKALYISFNGSIVKIYGGQVTDIHNYRAGYDGLPDTRRGNCSAIVPALSWLFASFDGGSSNYSTVMAYNDIGWCELMRGYKAGARIRNIFWQACPETHPRLWVDINGELVSISFPRNGANPLRDSASTYQHEAVMITGTIDMNERSLYKMASVIRCLSEDLSNGVIDVDYQIDDDIGATTWSGYNIGFFSSSPNDTIYPYIGGKHQFRFRYRLRSSSATVPPIIKALTPEGELKSTEKWQWSGILKFGANIRNKVGAVSDPDAELEWLKERARMADKLILYSSNDPAIDEKIVVIESPSRTVEHYDSNGKWSGSVYLTIREA